MYPYLDMVPLETINLLGARALLIICADFVRQKNRCARSLMMSTAALTKFQGQKCFWKQSATPAVLTFAAFATYWVNHSMAAHRK